MKKNLLIAVLFAFNCIISVGERLQCGNQKV